MIGTQLHWVPGPWQGKLALAARPRGNDWLDDELAAWRRRGVDVVVSLLTPDEEADLGLVDESIRAHAHGLDYWAFPMADREIPASEREYAQLIERLDADLARGRNIVVHCRQGVGRTGLVAVGALIARGAPLEQAIRLLSEVRGVEVPETTEQRAWLEDYAAAGAPSSG